MDSFSCGCGPLRPPLEEGANPLVATTGQLFWSTVEQSLGEEASVQFAVPLDGRWHEYVLDLQGHPAWRGVVDRLRLDPVEVAGVKIEIDEVRLRCNPPRHGNDSQNAR